MVISWASMMRVVGRTFIRDISDVAGVMVGVVLDMLDTTVGEEHAVAALDIAVAVTSLAGVVVAAAVVVVDPVLVGVGVQGLLVRWGVVVDRGGGVVHGGEHRGEVIIRKS